MPARRIARFDAFEFELTTLELRRQGRRVRLAPQPARVLTALVTRPGELVTREELKPAVWTEGTFVEFDQGLTFCIKRLRAALMDDARDPRFIETIPKRGYRFIAPVSIVEPDAAGPVAIAAAEPEVLALPAGRQGGRMLSRAPLAAAAALISAVAVAATIAFWSRSSTTGAAVPLRIAVLPFANLSGDANQDYLSEGIVEELIAQLNRVEPGRLAVVARSSSMRYGGARHDIVDIVSALNVKYLVEGSVRRANGRIRVTAQLVDPRQQTPMWSNTYERDAADLLPLQEDVAAAIANEVGTALARPSARRRLDPRVHELYLQGRFFWNRRSPDALARAAALFREALKIDPEYARAHAGLGDASMSGALGISDRPAFAAGLASADRALALDPTLSEAYATRAHALTHLFDWSGAERAYRRAIELDPNNVPARYTFAEWLYCQGRFAEAIRESQRARDLDPVSAIATHALGVAHLFARDFDTAGTFFRAALELDPRHAWSHDRLGQVHEARGDGAAAREDFERFRALDGRQVLPLLRVDARFGDRARARAGIEEALRAKPTDVIGAVWAYAALGDRDAAFAWLDRAFALGHYQLVFVAVDPRLDALRDDPRFAAALRRIGLPAVALARPTS
jgi:TolB-like protein/DNA-binding winged helix-turn-helix (wHTH) protein/Tfp pilus assembly protein PilF